MANPNDSYELQKAYSFHQNGNLNKAAEIYRRLIAADPKNYQALHFLGLVEAAAGNLKAAKTLMSRSLSIQPPNITFIENYATLLFNSGDYDSSLEICARGFRINNKNAQLLYTSAISFYKLEKFSESLSQFDKLIALQPDHIAAINERGSVLAEMKQFDAALTSFDRALALDPRYAPAYFNRGNACVELRRLDEARAAYEKAFALQPDYAEAWHGLGNVFFHLKRFDEALAAYDKALAIKTDFAKTWHDRGRTLYKLKRHDEAAASYSKVLEIDPQFEFAKGYLLHEKMASCDWEGFNRLVKDVESDVSRGKLSVVPLAWEALSSSNRSLQLCSALYTKRRFPAHGKRLARQSPRTNLKIRIGYSSGEFRNQATSFLLVGVLEQHDRSKFEIYAVDNGTDDKSEIRRRIENSVSRVINVTNLSDFDAAAAIGESQIDILVNLNGYFGDSRMGVFAQRPAPIQVNYLGFPGTLGADYMDYLIADQRLIPALHQRHYAEKIVYLPNSYQPNDRKRHISGKAFTRAQAGLPETGFVFCCFNNNFKITPDVFDSWMRILTRIEASVLWLLEDNEIAAKNLKREASARGVNPDRLVFAPRIELSDHLARHRLADLFLDTLPYNAHTTASDALWAGLPVLTQIGDTFAGRVAASLLNAVRLPELITPTREAYEALALELAANPAKLADIKRKLADNRLTTPLFDTELFTRHIEAAYTLMYDRYQKHLPPAHIHVPE